MRKHIYAQHRELCPPSLPKSVCDALTNQNVDDAVTDQNMRQFQDDDDDLREEEVE